MNSRPGWIILIVIIILNLKSCTGSCGSGTMSAQGCPSKLIYVDCPQ